jgi:hypothetical protein
MFKSIGIKCSEEYKDVCLRIGPIKCILKGCNELSPRCRLKQLQEIEEQLNSEDQTDRTKAHARLWRLRHTEQVKKSRKRYYEENEKGKARKKNKRNRVKEQRYRAANKDRLNEYNRNYYQLCKEVSGEDFLEEKRKNNHKSYKKKKRIKKLIAYNKSRSKK